MKGQPGTHPIHVTGQDMSKSIMSPSVKRAWVDQAPAEAAALYFDTNYTRRNALHIRTI